MKRALVDDIIKAVRYHLNEELANESFQLTEVGDDVDETDIDDVVKSHIMEAVDCVHVIAAPDLLDGVKAVLDTDYSMQITDEVIPEIKTLVPMLRIFSFRAYDSPFNVRETVAEGSPEGHKQLKPYTRGTWDRPALMVMADSEDYKPHLKYYTLAGTPLMEDGDIISEFLYIPKQFDASVDENGKDYWLVSSQLYESFINYLTGLVLNTYGEYDRAQVYFTRAKNE